MTGVTNETQLAEAIARMQALAGDMSDVKTAMRQLADAVTKLAVVEERQASDRAAIGRAFNELEDHERRLRAIEQTQPLQKQSSEWVGKIITQVVAMVVSALVTTVVITRFAGPASVVAPAPQHQGTTP